MTLNRQSPQTGEVYRDPTLNPQTETLADIVQNGSGGSYAFKVLPDGTKVPMTAEEVAQQKAEIQAILNA